MKRENPPIEICPGITRRTVAYGKSMYQMIATLAGRESRACAKPSRPSRFSGASVPPVAKSNFKRLL
jgi:hypothetical protein